MPLSIQCKCGKTLRVKDEFAGKKVRCPACKEVLSVPVPEMDVEVEEDALNVLLIDEPNPPSPSRKETAIQDERASRRPAKPSSPPKPVKVDYETERPRKRSVGSRPRERESRGYSGIAINGSIITGLLMMLGAVVWFVAGLAGGIIFFYPIILFVFGIAAIYRGFTGQEE